MTQSSPSSVSSFEFIDKEARKLQYSNNRHKGENEWLEKRLKHLETENEGLKTDLENIETDQNCNCKKIIINCENCPKHLERIEYLMRTLNRFSLGRNNLDAILGS